MPCPTRAKATMAMRSFMILNVSYFIGSSKN
jgi:hypothetical protein